MIDFKEFEKKVMITFSDQNLLKQVFTHRSFLNENPSLKLESNERLEFLGDAVLELIVTEFMYHKYQNPEGVLTTLRSVLVCGKKLAELAKKLDMEKYLLLSRGEEKMGGRTRELLLANVFEALIGAIYLENGYTETKKFLEKHLLVKMPSQIEKKFYLDPKTELQEIVQEDLSITPTYEVLEETGPDHDKVFTIGVFLNNKKIGTGIGSSKQTAQSAAAENALKKYQEKE